MAGDTRAPGTPGITKESGMTYRATLYYTGGRTQSATVKAESKDKARQELRKLPGWECVKLEEVR